MRSLAYASPWGSAQALGHVAENIDELDEPALTVERSDLDRLASAIPLADGEGDTTVRQPLDRVPRGVGRARSEVTIGGDILFEELDQIRSLGHRKELRRGTLPLVRREPHDLADRVREHLERPITAGRIDVRAERVLVGVTTSRRVGALAVSQVRETALGDRLVRGHFVFRWGLAPVCLPSYYNRPSGNRQVVSVAFFCRPVQHRFGSTTLTA